MNRRKELLLFEFIENKVREVLIVCDVACDEYMVVGYGSGSDHDV